MTKTKLHVIQKTMTNSKSKCAVKINTRLQSQYEKRQTNVISLSTAVFCG